MPRWINLPKPLPPVTPLCKMSFAKKSLRVCLAQMDVIPGQPEQNTAHMLAIMRSAQAAQAELVIFPELAIPGCFLGDVWDQPAFLRECVACGERIREAAGDLIVVFGNVAVDWSKKNEDGRPRKYNALFVAHAGKFRAPDRGLYPFVVKALMPNYRAFDDSRHFYDLRKLAIENNKLPADLTGAVCVAGLKLGCLVCEDVWDADYSFSPLAILKQTAPDLYINCNCSPFTRGKADKRRRVLSAQAAGLKRPLIYLNAVGLQNIGKTVFVFDGVSCVYDGPERRILLPAFEETAPIIDLPLDGSPCGEVLPATGDEMAEIYAALVDGARRFLKLCKVERVVIGVSGGIDSAVAAALYRQVLPPENILAVNMPSRHNSPITINLARQLAANLGCFYAEIPIDESIDLTLRQLNNLTITSVDGQRRRELVLDAQALDNVQARDRGGRILAALAAAFGGVFACNANKSETTVGYSTFYGDLAGFFALLGDLWKHDVYQLGEYLNREIYRREVIPEGCFTIKPSAELGPHQAVEEGKGDPLIYPYHDRLFASWVEWWQRVTPEEILKWYLDGTLTERLGYDGDLKKIFPTVNDFIADLEYWWRQFQGLGVAKRLQAPPIMAVTRRAFGFDLREAQNTPWFSRRYYELKQDALKAQR